MPIDIRFDGTAMTNRIPNAPGGNNVQRLSVDVDGSLWAAFQRFYVGKLTPSGTWVNYNTAVAGIEVPSNQFTNLGLLADSQGYKWFCSLPSPTLHGLDDRTDAVYGNDTWTRYGIDSGGGDGLGSLSLQRGLEDPIGNRWFLGDISRLETNGWQGIHILSRDGSEWFEMTPTKDPRMASGDIVDVAFGSNFVYVAHRTAGIQLWALDGYDWALIEDVAGDGWQTRVPSTALPATGFVAGIELTSDNVLWIATAAGLFRYPSTRPNAVVDEIPVYVGIGSGILTRSISDIALDHDENLWVATSLGLNKIAHDNETNIETYTTASADVTALADLRYPLSIISPLSNADCRSLAVHSERDVVYIGTLAGVTVLDYSPPAVVSTDLSKVYVYPNPVYTSKGHVALKIANLTGPVSVEIYNLEGGLVDSRTVSTDGDVAWDLTTKDGFNAGSGKYIVRIVGESGSVQRPFALIR